MPYRTKRTKGRRKGRPARVYKKGARRHRKGPLKVFYGGKASQAIIKQPSGLPDRLYVKLRYREQLNFSQTLGTLGVNVYRGNGPFDPNATGTGGQPYFYDSWSSFYTQVRCLASKITVRSMLNANTVGNTIVVVCPSSSAVSFGSSGQELIEEQPYAKTSMMKATIQGGWGYTKHYMGTAKALSVKKVAVDAEDDFQSLTTTVPAAQWYWHVANYVPGGANQSLIQDINITYYMVFEGRNRPAVS